MKVRSRGGSRTAATSKMERFMIIGNGWKPLTIITKRSILRVAAALDPALRSVNRLSINQTLNQLSKVSVGRHSEQYLFGKFAMNHYQNICDRVCLYYISTLLANSFEHLAHFGFVCLFFACWIGHESKIAGLTNRVQQVKFVQSYCDYNFLEMK